MNKRIIIPLLSDYYLFDYYKFLVPRLVADGFQVTLLTNDRRLLATVAQLMPNIPVFLGPSWVRWASNRAGSIIPRIMLWVFSWLWAMILRRRFDFVIVPWDYRVLWYALSRLMPALTIHNTTDFLDIELKLGRVYLPEKEMRKPWHRLLACCDRMLQGRLLPRANGKLLRYRKTWLIDRLMGCRSVNGQQGFSGIRYFTVMGKKIKENYQHLGVGVPPNPTEIFVVGSPNYEFLPDLPASFCATEREHLLSSLGVPPDALAFVFFLSPSHFSDMQIREVGEVVDAVATTETRAWFVLKFHPKTRKGDPERVLASLGAWRHRATIVTQFGGDEWNAKLVLASHCLVQKQSTVGYIAMFFGIPILSYNLYPTDYDDEMYRLIGGSFHAESRGELIANVERLKDPSERQRLSAMQQEACCKFCCMERSPCGEISAIIQRHFAGRHS